MIVKLKLWICRVFYFVGLYWWQLWSHFYQTLWGIKNGSFELPRELNSEEILDKFSLLTWQEDGPKELWDVCAGAEWVQMALTEIELGNPQPPGGLDCDDFAMWAVRVAREDYFPHFFILTWLSEDNKIKGHAMCLIHFNHGQNCFLSNWGMSDPFMFISDGCKKILEDVEAKELIGWAAFDENLCRIDGAVSALPARSFI